MNRRQRSILAVATLSQAVAIGVTVGVFPLFLEPLEASFGAPRTQIALGPILVMMALALAGIVAGSVLDKGRVRRAMLFGSVLLATGLVTASLAPNLWILALGALAAGFAIPFIGPLAGMTLVTRTFDADQGRALGMMSMGPAMGSGFFAGLAGFLLRSLDWREIYLSLAVGTILFLTPLIGWVIPARLDAPSRRRTATGSVVGLGDILRRPVFWWSALVFALAAGIGTGWTNHVGAFLAGVGLTDGQVTALVAVQFWMGVPGALVFGMLADRFPLVALWCVMLGLEAVVFAAYASGVTPLWAAILGVAFGFVAGGLIPLYMVFLGQRLEAEILGRAMGMSNLVMLPVMAFAAILAASIYESHGNYARAAAIFSLGMLASIGSLLLSNRSAAKR
jgi:predicted MFS family arabinose efflux permease